MKVTRRGLFTMFGRKKEFSLNDFYAQRAARGEVTASTDPVPEFPLRPGLPQVETSQIGVVDRDPPKPR